MTYYKTTIIKLILLLVAAAFLIFVVILCIKQDTIDFEKISHEETMIPDYDNLPDLPLIEISTSTGKDPEYEEAKKPDKNLWGASIVNNKYSDGELQITKGSDIKKYDSISIKIFGNVSAIQDGKSRIKSDLTLRSACLMMKENSRRKTGCCLKKEIL